VRREREAAQEGEELPTYAEAGKDRPFSVELERDALPSWGEVSEGVGESSRAHPTEGVGAGDAGGVVRVDGMDGMDGMDRVRRPDAALVRERGAPPGYELRWRT
jgi:hypothetical protein